MKIHVQVCFSCTSSHKKFLGLREVNVKFTLNYKEINNSWFNRGQFRRWLNGSSNPLFLSQIALKFFTLQPKIPLSNCQTCCKNWDGNICTQHTLYSCYIIYFPIKRAAPSTVFDKYLIRILTHTASYLKRTIATASFMTLSPNTKAYRSTSTSTCRSWKIASTVTAKQITVILHLSLWWIYKRCKQENQHWEGLGNEGGEG